MEDKGVVRPLDDVAPHYCHGTIKLAREGCKSTPIEHTLVGILILATLCYFLCWTLCIYFSKHGLDAKPYSDFKVGNLMLRIQVPRVAPPGCPRLEQAATAVPSPGGIVASLSHEQHMHTGGASAHVVM